MTTPLNSPPVTLLDETDVAKRLIQHGAILLGIGVLASAAVVADRNKPLALAIIAAGLGLLVASMMVRQIWEVFYKGHQIRIVTDPLRGEYLLLDGVRVARGKLGFRSEMRIALASGEKLTVLTDASFVSLRCRILVEPAEPAVGQASLSDEQLLAEIRRRGLRA